MLLGKTAQQADQFGRAAQYVAQGLFVAQVGHRSQGGEQMGVVLGGGGVSRRTRWRGLAGVRVCHPALLGQPAQQRAVQHLG